MSSWYKIYGQYMVPPNPASPDLPTPTQEVYQSAMSATRAAVEGGHALLPGLGTKQAAEATLGVPGATYPHPYTMQEAAQYSGTDAANFCGPDYVYTGNHPLLGYAPAVGINGASAVQTMLWQRFLGNSGYNLGRACVDGDYGPKTRAATKAFQGDSNIEVTADGTANSTTVRAAIKVGFGCGSKNQALSAVEKRTSCSGAHSPGTPSSSGGSSASGGSSTNGGSSEGVNEGLLTDVSAKVFTPRNLLIGVGVLAFGAGAFALVRSQPAQRLSLSTANRYSGEGW